MSGTAEARHTIAVPWPRLIEHIYRHENRVENYRPSDNFIVESRRSCRSLFIDQPVRQSWRSFSRRIFNPGRGTRYCSRNQGDGYTYSPIPLSGPLVDGRFYSHASRFAVVGPKLLHPILNAALVIALKALSGCLCPGSAD